MVNLQLLNERLEDVRRAKREFSIARHNLSRFTKEEKRKVRDLWDSIFTIYEWVESEPPEYISATPCILNYWIKPEFEDALKIVQDKINRITEESGKQIVDKLLDYDIFDLRNSHTYHDIITEYNIIIELDNDKQWQIYISREENEDDYEDDYEDDNKFNQEIEWLNPCSTKFEAMYKAVIISKSKILVNFEIYEDVCDEE